MTTIVTATLAAVASSAAIQLERRAETLPARYGLEIASPIPELNGVRLRFLNGKSAAHPQVKYLLGICQLINFCYRTPPDQSRTRGSL